MRRNKKMLSKLTALCLTIALVLAMGITASAAIRPEDRGSITVTGIATDKGTTVKAYKVIDVNFDTTATGQQPVEPVYTWNTAVAEWVGANYSAYISTDDVVTEAYHKATAAALRDFYKAMAEAEPGVLGDAAGTATIGDPQTETINNVEMGQYVLIATAGEGVTASYLPVTADVLPKYEDGTGWQIVNAAVVLKGSAPGIEKEAKEHQNQDDTVQIGHTVDYQLTVDIPSYPAGTTNQIFYVQDKLSPGLTFNEDVNVYIGNDENANTSLADTYYTYDDANTAYTFKVDFGAGYDAIKTDYPNFTKIVIKYSAVVNENAFTTDALGNKALIGYNNDPSGEDPKVIETTEEVYTYAINLKKIAENVEFLSGAEFELRNSNAEGTAALKFVKVEDGVYRLPVTSDAEADKTTKLTVKSDDGTLKIQGLDLGSYYLRETKAPNGYVLPKNDVEIVLAEDTSDNKETDGVLEGGEFSKVSLAGSSATVTNVTVTGNVVDFDLVNISYEDEEFQLPKTGGAGTILFTVLGILLMGGAVTLIVVSKKRGQSK